MASPLELRPRIGATISVDVAAFLARAEARGWYVTLRKYSTLLRPFQTAYLAHQVINANSTCKSETIVHACSNIIL